MKKSLYISHSKRGGIHYYLDASARYRCIFPCEYNEEGHTKHCIHFNQIDHIDLSNYQTVIFHRPSISLKLKKTLKNLKRLNIKAVVDFDDLLFAPQYALQNPTYLSGNMSGSYAKRAINKYYKALMLFEFVQTSTEPLTEHVKAIHPNCSVETHYNMIPNRWTELAPHIPANERFNNKIIRYFPGTSHHTTNFKSAIRTLKLILNTNKDIKLEIIGDLHIPENTFPKIQFNQLPYVLYEELPKLIANSWITISPLEDNEFNRCKSALKFWESACFGVPVISNKNPDMQRLECSALLLSNNHEDWLSYINQLKNLDNYIKISEIAYKNAEQCIYLDEKNIKTDNSTINLIMSAKFGPTWPSIKYNPTHNKYKSCLETLEKITNKNNLIELNETEIDKLIKEEKKQRDDLLLQTTNTKRFNKLKKLKNNPILFFTDMVKNLKR